MRLRNDDFLQLRDAILFAAAITCGAGVECRGLEVAAKPRVAIAVVPMTSLGTSPQDLRFSTTFQDGLASALSRQEGLQLIERTELGGIMKELRFQQSGAVDPRTMSTVGSIAGAEYLLLADVRTMGESVRLSARVVSVDEGIVVLGRLSSGPAERFAVLREEFGRSFALALPPALVNSRRRGERPLSPSRLRAIGALAEGSDHAFHRRFRQAADCYQKAVALDPSFADGHFQLGVALTEMHELDAALQEIERALGLFSARQEESMVVSCRLFRARILRKLGDPQRALEQTRLAVDEAGANGSALLRAEANAEMGAALLGLGRYRQSLVHLEKSSGYFESVGNLTNKWLVDGNIAMAKQFQGALAEALEILKPLSIQFQDAGERRHALETFAQIGDVYGIEGDWRKLLEISEAGLAYAGAGQDLAIPAASLHMQAGQALLRLDADAMAIRHYALAAATFERVKDWSKLYEAAYDMAFVYARGHENALAAERLETAVRALSKVHDSSADLLRCFLMLARLYEAVGKMDKSIDMMERAVGLDQMFRAGGLEGHRKELRRLRASRARSGVQSVGEDFKYLFEDRIAVISLIDASPQGAHVRGFEMIGFQVAEALVDFPALVVVERSQVEQVLAEMKFHATGAVDDATAVQVGRLAGATLGLFGSYSLVKDDILLELRVVQVATGKIVATASARADSKSPALAVKAAMSDLKDELSRRQYSFVQ